MNKLKMKNIIHIYGLLHIDSTQVSAMNVHVIDFKHQIKIYLKNAATLSQSLRNYGVKFTLITNNKDFLSSIQCETLIDLKIVDVKMNSYVPEGLIFYSAHYKLEVFKYIANSGDEYAAFCDLDMVAINNPSNEILSLFEDKISLYYDITDQVTPKHTASRIDSDLSLLIGESSNCRWAGGEFLAGTPNFFNNLSATIEKIIPMYFENIKKMHHVGDESFTSAALEIMRRNGVTIVDAGALGVVNRYWSVRTAHKQHTLSSAMTTFLIHLPSSKKLLAFIYNHPLMIKRFKMIFLCNIFFMKFFVCLKSLLKNIKI